MRPQLTANVVRGCKRLDARTFPYANAYGQRPPNLAFEVDEASCQEGLGVGRTESLASLDGAVLTKPRGTRFVYLILTVGLPATIGLRYRFRRVAHLCYNITNFTVKGLSMTDTKSPTKMSLPDALDRLSDATRERVVKTAQDMKATVTAPPMELSLRDDTLVIRFDCESTEIATLLQMADIGTTDGAFHDGLVGQIASLGSHGQKLSSANSNFVLSVVRSVKPRDELEALLATQMGAIHAATMMLARRLNHVETIPQQDASERALNKLARTFTTQMDALKRYRTGGQQKVTVEHVTVNQGGQAIVGGVEMGKGRMERG